MKRMFVLFVFLCNVAFGSTDDAYNAACRVDSQASGVAYKEDDESIWILSAGLVIDFVELDTKLLL